MSLLLMVHPVEGKKAVSDGMQSPSVPAIAIPQTQSHGVHDKSNCTFSVSGQLGEIPPTSSSSELFCSVLKNFAGDTGGKLGREASSQSEPPQSERKKQRGIKLGWMDG